MKRYCFRNNDGNYFQYMTRSSVYTSKNFDDALWLNEKDFSVQEVMAFCKVVNKVSDEGSFSVKVQNMDIVDFDPLCACVKDQEVGLK